MTEDYGAPESAWIELEMLRLGGGIDVTVSLVNKRPTRHAEALFLKLGRAPSVKSMEVRGLARWTTLQNDHPDHYLDLRFNAPL